LRSVTHEDIAVRRKHEAAKSFDDDLAVRNFEPPRAEAGVFPMERQVERALSDELHLSARPGMLRMSILGFRVEARQARLATRKAVVRGAQCVGLSISIPNASRSARIRNVPFRSNGLNNTAGLIHLPIRSGSVTICSTLGP
jgi:hypothetical protein